MLNYGNIFGINKMYGRKDNMLIIWDFDGVICDSDYIWAENWATVLKERYDIELTEKQKRSWLIGISEKDKAGRLEAELPKVFGDKLSKKFGDNIPEKLIDDDFKKELNILHNKAMHDKQRLKLTPGVEEIFKDKNFKQCIATGATQEQSNIKNDTVGIDKYFTWGVNCFTAGMPGVERGKPFPDIFLHAAKSMGFDPKDAVVIEDSIDGIKAAKAAGMKVFAFVGAVANNNPEYISECKKLGVDGVFDNMRELHQALKDMDKQHHRGSKLNLATINRQRV